MKIKKYKNKEKPFKVIFEYSNTPDAEERLLKALNMLVTKEDISAASLVKDK